MAVNTEEHHPVVLLLDDTILGSQLLSRAFQHQRNLHNVWLRTMESFYKLHATVIPLEYCVRPIKIHIQHQLEDYLTSQFGDRIFIYQFGETLGEALLDQRNYLIPQLNPTLNFFGHEKRMAKFPNLDIKLEGKFMKENDISSFMEPLPKKIKREENEELEMIPVELRNNREHMKKMCEKNGKYLYYAHPGLLHDRELLLVAIKSNGEAFKYVPHLLKKDEDFVIQSLQLNGDAFLWLNSTLRARKDLFEISLRTSGKPYTAVSDLNLRDCKFSTFQAVSKHWHIIKIINNKVDYFLKLVEMVLLKGISDEELFNSNLLSNKDIVLKMLDISYKAFLIASAECTADLNIIEKAIRKNSIVANYFTTDQFLIISKEEEIIETLFQNPNIDMKKFARVIIEKSSPQNIRSLVVRYPEFAREFEANGIDPFILRYLLPSTQNEICAKIVTARYSLPRDLESLGFLFLSSLDNIVEKLVKRFAISHPGLVVPFHRFGTIPTQTNLWSEPVQGVIMKTRDGNYKFSNGKEQIERFKSSFL